MYQILPLRVTIHERRTIREEQNVCTTSNDGYSLARDVCVRLPRYIAEGEAFVHMRARRNDVSQGTGRLARREMNDRILGARGRTKLALSRVRYMYRYTNFPLVERLSYGRVSTVCVYLEISNSIRPKFMNRRRNERSTSFFVLPCETPVESGGPRVNGHQSSLAENPDLFHFCIFFVIESG